MYYLRIQFQLNCNLILHPLYQNKILLVAIVCNVSQMFKKIFLTGHLTFHQKNTGSVLVAWSKNTLKYSVPKRVKNNINTYCGKAKSS